MLEKIKANIENNNLLSFDENVVVGFSGGADSSLLVYALNKLGYKVIAVHIHHGIRGDEADRDMLFAENFCKQYNITFFCEKRDIPAIAKESGESLETSARFERYKILNQYALNYNAKIAVAHNKNDQAETVLMHLLRGSSLNGLCGIQFKTNNIIRPLLNISRNEIECFNKEHFIDYVYDSTNFCQHYTRNKLRLDIIPRLSDAFSVDAVENISKCAETLSEYNEYINSFVDEYEKQYILKEENKIVLQKNNLPRMINIELIKRAIKLLNGNIVDIEKIHLESVYSLFEKESGKEVHLPFNVKAKKIYDDISFFTQNDTFHAQYNFQPNEIYQWQNNSITSCFVEKFKKEKNCEFLDFSKLPQNLVLRTREKGDYIYPLGSDGKCSLKKFFIDKKIPSDIRNELPLLALGSEIYAIIGYTVSDKVKITTESTEILKVFWKNKF